MSWEDALGGVLKKYTSGSGAVAQPAPALNQQQINQQQMNEQEVNGHFDQVSQSAPPNVMAQGLAAAFRSDATPAFAQMLSTLFRNSNSDQKAGLLNHLLSSLPPGSLAQIFSGTSLAGLSGASAKVTPQQAEQVSPEAVQQIGANAEKSNPSIVDSVSDFYAQHSTLVKTLGAAALAIALRKVAEGRR